MKKKSVFVINKSSHDFSGAERFGNIVFMTEGSLPRFATSKMFRAFAPYIEASKPSDYILLSAMTVMCSIACAMFAAKHGRVNLLIYKPDPIETSKYVERVIIINEGSKAYGHKKGANEDGKQSG